MKPIGKLLLTFPGKYWKDLTLAALIFTAVTVWMQRDMLQLTQQADNFVLPGLSTPSAAILNPGERTLVYFFAPWCNICKLSIGNLSRLNDELHTVAVALDYKNAQQVATFVGDRDLKVPVLLGNTQVAAAYQISVYPSYYVIDGQGKVLGRSAGYSSLAGLLWRTQKI